MTLEYYWKSSSAQIKGPRCSVFGTSLLEQRIKGEHDIVIEMDEGRKRVLAIVAGILVARHLNTADDLFGGPQGSPRTDKMIAAAVQWAERIMRKIDEIQNQE